MVGSDITTISTFPQPGHSDLIQKEELPQGTAAAGDELSSSGPRCVLKLLTNDWFHSEDKIEHESSKSLYLYSYH